MDDDSVVDFDLLFSLLERTATSKEDTILCPTVFRNMKPFRHPDAKVSGKWAYSYEVIPGKFVPDFCPGFLYVTSTRVGLALAETARVMGDQVWPDKMGEDYMTGFLAERLPWVTLRSLSPVGGDMWDNFFSHCPFLTLLRYSWNPLALGAGSAESDLQYVNSPRYVFCISAEFVLYQYLHPLGFTWDIIWDGCRR